MALFGDSVPRDVYEDVKKDRDHWRTAHAALVEKFTAQTAELVAIKRHEMGLPPAGFEPKDPASVLGKRTLAAIDEAAMGDASLRAHYLNFAIRETATATASEGESLEDADRMIALRILRGDEAA